MLGKTAHVSDADLAQAATPSEPSEPFPPKGKQENTNNISERDDGNSRGTEYDRGFKDGREQACSLLKSIGLFDFEPPNGNRVTWLTQAILEDSVQAVELLLDMGTEINQESPLEDSKGYHITASVSSRPITTLRHRKAAFGERSKYRRSKFIGLECSSRCRQRWGCANHPIAVGRIQCRHRSAQ